MARKNVVFQPLVVPEAGQRVGAVDGPGQFPADNAGTIMCQITDRWGTRALVVMDKGGIKVCEGLNRGPGIGFHLL